MVEYNAVSILAAAFGIVGFIGGAVGYFAKGRGDSIIKYQAIEISNRDGTIARLKEENTAKTVALKEKNDQIGRLEEHNKYLQELAKGSPELKALNKTVTNLTKVIRDKLKKA